MGYFLENSPTGTVPVGYSKYNKDRNMENEETRVAVLAIILEDISAAGQVNEILHEYNDSVIGRMGIPYREKGLSIISIALDAPQNVINTLAGKIGRIEGVTAKTVTSQK